MIVLEPKYRLEGIADGWCICCMSDGRLFFERQDHFLCLWKPEEDRMQLLLQQDKDVFLEAAAPLDATHLACIGSDDKLIVWDTKELREIQRSSYDWNGSPYYRPDRVSAGDGWFALGFYLGHIGVYDSQTFELLAELPEADSQVWTLQALPGKRLLFGRVEGDLAVWNWETTEVKSLRESGSMGDSWRLEADGHFFTLPEGFELFSIGENERVISCQVRRGEDVRLAVEPHWLVTGKESGSVEFFNMASGEIFASGDGGWLIRRLCKMPGGRVASLSEKGILSVWQIPAD